MSNIQFYYDPLITRDHRVVRKYGIPYGSPVANIDVPDFVPVWSGTMSLDIPRKLYNTGLGKSAPNYAIIYACGANIQYFVQVRNVTDETISMDFTVDWWGTYYDALKVTGTQTRGLDRGTYAIAPTFDPNPSIQMSPVGTSNFVGDGLPCSRKYHAVVVIQCYSDDPWPIFPDGQPYQVTYISRQPFSVADILGFGSLANEYNAFMQPKASARIGYSHTTARKVISVLRRQLIPYDMLHDTTPAQMFDAGASDYGWLALYSDVPDNDTEVTTVTHMAGITYAALSGQFGDSVGAPTGYSRPLPFVKYAVQTRQDTLGANGSDVRLYLGNLHTRISTEDVPSSAGTIYTVGSIRLTMTLNNGLTVEIENGDHLTDITDLFDAGVVYNSEQEMRYQAGDSKKLAAIAAGIGAARSVASGTVALGSGNAGGIFDVASGITGGISAAASLQYRGKQIVMGGDSTTIADVGTDPNSVTYKAGDGLFNLVFVHTKNAAERAIDAQLHGLVLTTPRARFDVEVGTLPDLEGSVPNPVSPPDQVPFKIENPIVTPIKQTANPVDSQTGSIIVSPDDMIIAEAEMDLARGILAVSSGLQTLEPPA